ncbi:MAG TPA: hypothetical protein VGC41_22140 [Kofleriaceae bacterium]
MERLSPYTRSAPIETEAVYADAKQRLGCGEVEDAPIFGMRIGDDYLDVERDWLRIGGHRFRRDEVERRALNSETLQLYNGGCVQAGLAMLVAEAHGRGAREGFRVLEERVAAYELATRPMAAR